MDNFRTVIGDGYCWKVLYEDDCALEYAEILSRSFLVNKLFYGERGEINFFVSVEEGLPLVETDQAIAYVNSSTSGFLEIKEAEYALTIYLLGVCWAKAKCEDGNFSFWMRLFSAAITSAQQDLAPMQYEEVMQFLERKN